MPRKCIRAPASVKFRLMSTHPWEELAPQGPSALQTQKFSRRWRSTHVSGRTPTCGRRGPRALRASSGHSGRPGARGLSAEVTSHEHRCAVCLSLFKKHPPTVTLLPRADCILTGVSEDKTRYARFSSTIGTWEPSLPENKDGLSRPAGSWR